MMAMTATEYLSIYDIAADLNRPYTSTLRLVTTEIPYEQIGRIYRVKRSDYEAWKASKRVVPQKAQTPERAA